MLPLFFHGKNMSTEKQDKMNIKKRTFWFHLVYRVLFAISTSNFNNPSPHVDKQNLKLMGNIYFCCNDTTTNTMIRNHESFIKLTLRTMHISRASQTSFCQTPQKQETNPKEQATLQ